MKTSDFGDDGLHKGVIGLQFIVNKLFIGSFDPDAIALLQTDMSKSMCDGLQLVGGGFSGCTWNQYDSKVTVRRLGSM